MNLPPVILASASPRRAELLRQLVPEFRIVPSNVPELLDDQLTAWEQAQLNACRKARTVAKRFRDALVIGADTIVCLPEENKLFGKPGSIQEAVQMLKQLQGRTHAVITGLCLTHYRLNKQTVCAEWTDVRFHPLTEEQIRRYLDLVNPLDKAGAYAIQEHGELLVAEISGSYSNVVGLPLERLSEELRRWSR
ncbi:MAG: Maf family protein [Verrucomicrobiae bacterium]|nr:Maf family protein [Verrucomicrobiae bacterium]MCX7722348.1 Maf family protein [Verrucomicrobiae bacterium]MDW7979201.1 Maf family protein [Verrucomicrobiales bacterium]